MELEFRTPLWYWSRLSTAFAEAKLKADRMLVMAVESAPYEKDVDELRGLLALVSTRFDEAIAASSKPAEHADA